MAGVIVLDANALIAYLAADDAHHAAVVDFLALHVAEGYGASVLTIAEALVHPTRHGVTAAAAASFERLALRELPIDPDHARRLALIRAETGLRLPAVVVVHAAEVARSPLATLDAVVAREARRRGIIVLAP